MPVNQICQQDCIEGMQSLKEKTVDLVFADPPFNIGYNYDVYNDRHSPDEYLNWSENWLREVYRILKPNGTLWLAIGDDFAAELKILLTHKIGMFCRNWIIWYYTFGVHCQKKFTRSHTHLFYMVKNANRFTFNDSEIRVPSARQTIYHDKRASSKGRIPDDTWVLRPQEIPNGFDGEQSVWYFARVCGTFKERAGWHGCQMPEKILARIIQTSSNPGDLVLDPFLGSGTTVAVAKKLGRRYLGFELSDSYLQACQKRLDSIKEGDPIL
ncbi:MAG: site-specific DNA-methyltransferase [Planctomycetia bacterium]|nr:site-specific DNA-methyltransferase [Planctomycetia bacterium]